VVNFDLPNIPETYVHRIGRTGRAGASGIALSFCDGEEVAYLKDIQKLIGQLVPVVEDHPFPADLTAPTLAPKPAQRNQQRPAQRQSQPQRKPQRTHQTEVPAPNPHKSRANGEGGNRNESRPPREERPMREDRPMRDGQRSEQRPARDGQRQHNDQRPQRDGQRSEQRPQRDGQRSEQRPQRDGQRFGNNERPQREKQFSGERREEPTVFPERKSRFASILEVSKLEKQPSFNKPKPAYKDRSNDMPRDENAPKKGNSGRSSWRGNDRAKKTR
jgi:superfamily II DNA/RNA helicase